MSIQESIKQSKFESEHQKMLINIIYTSNWLDSVIRDSLNKFDLTHVQFNILRILAGSAPKPLSPGDIKKVMLFRNPDVTRLVDRLVLKGLVIREACPDNRRKMDIYISDSGIELLQKVNPALKAATEDYYEAKMTEAEASLLSDLLDKMRE